MKISLTIIIGSLVLAILATILVESRFSRVLGQRVSSKFAGFAFLCCFGVCVGVVSGLVSYFFHVREWVAILIAVPLGVPVLLLAARVGES